MAANNAMTVVRTKTMQLQARRLNIISKLGRETWEITLRHFMWAVSHCIHIFISCSTGKPTSETLVFLHINHFNLIFRLYICTAMHFCASCASFHWKTMTLVRNRVGNNCRKKKADVCHRAHENNSSSNWWGGNKTAGSPLTSVVWKWIGCAELHTEYMRTLMLVYQSSQSFWAFHLWQVFLIWLSRASFLQ